jgi:macrolide transport system ATP-binding/permease protein
MTRWVRKLLLLAGRGRFRSELGEEMAFHRAQAERDLVACGMSPLAARYAAMRQLGNATRLREQSEEVVGFRVETVWQDMRYAVRQLRKNPGFGLTAVLILALGMGVSVAIFGFVDAALIQPLPYAQPNRLLSVDESTSRIEQSNFSRTDYEDWKRMNTTLRSLELYTGNGYLLRWGSTIVPVPGARVSDGFFRTLGVKPILGRDFLPGEDKPGGAKIVMLPYGTWVSRFGGRRDVVGQTVTLSGDAYTIVGVLPREFAFAPMAIAQLYVPLLDKNDCEQRRGCHNLDGVGRLRDGVTVEAARAEMQRIAAQLEAQYPDSNKGQNAYVVPLSEIIIGQVRPILLTLQAAALLLLLIACVNVASLLLVRSESRRREVAVRGALGATKMRMVRQFVTEGLLLAAAGCAAGLQCAGWLMKLIIKLSPKQMVDNVPFLSNVGLNGHTALFAGAVALGGAVLLAATPALRLAGQNMHAALAEGGRGAVGRFWQRLGMNLVVAELTVAVVLLAGAGLLGKSLYRLLHVEMGFEPSHLATVQVMAPDSTYTKPEQKVALFREIERRLLALPGVQSVGITSDLPVQCNCDTDWIRIVGKPFQGEHNEVNERDVSANYLRTLQARLIRGRTITEADDATKPQVVVINQALAKKYFPGEDPIGKKIGNGKLDPKSIREIVGVVADVREGGLDQDLWPAEYESIYYGPGNFPAVAMRTTQDAKTVLPVMVSTLHAIDPNLGVYGDVTMNDQIQSSQAALLHSFAMWLVVGFAVMALVLGVVGLYGVVAYSVSQRTREIGVRMALGAQRGTVYAMVMRQAGWLTTMGIVAGLACSVGASLAMKKLLFGVEAWDVPTLAGVALVLGGASLMASFLPARRAASVNPMEALRAE